MDELKKTLNEKSRKTLEFDKLLLKLANNCKSDGAKQLALLLLPAENLSIAKKLQQETTDAATLIAKKGTPALKTLIDIKNSVKRAEKGASLSCAELLNIAAVLSSAKSMKRYIEEDNRQTTSIDYLFQALVLNKTLEEKITGAILGENEIADNASNELFSIRRAIKGQVTKVRDVLNKLIKSSSYSKYLQDSIITVRGDRYVVPVKAEHRADVPGLVHDTSGSGATLFIEPMGVVEANNELKSLYAKEQKEIERILYELSADCANFSEAIINDYDLLIQLDFIFAKARFSYEIDAVEPLLNNKGIIDFKGARHPLIEKEKVVPTFVYLGKDFDTLVITGPNTGGKTVSLKTLGLLSIMAASGLHIPAKSGSEAAFFENILADIGDEQSIEQSLSTFSSHMSNITKIIDIVDKDSLVLFDELGAGTDPVEGAALAMAILERCRNFGARVAATTHYAELKMFALSTKGVENASCEFDVNTLSPTYKLITGVPGKSNAFAISKRLGLDEKLLDRAGELIDEENVKFEDVLEQLEQNRQQMEQAMQKAEHFKVETARLKNLKENEIAELNKLKEKELQKAKEQAKNIVEQAKAETQKIMDELLEIQKQKNKADFQNRLQNARHGISTTLNKLEKEVDPVTKKTDYYEPPKTLKKGDTVLIVDLDTKATVLSEPDKDGNVELMAGIMKTRSNISKLKLLEEQAKQTINSSIGVSKKNISVKTEIDLRGMASDEAIMEVDNYLDSAVIAGLNVVTLIHGKGTGVLRKSIWEHLKHHKHVKTHRPGVFGEGEMGVTVVELK